MKIRLPRLPYECRLERLEAKLDLILKNQETEVATLQEVQASEAAEDAEIKTLITTAQSTQTALTQASAALAALQAQQTISPTDLDAIKADMDAQATAIGAALAPAAPAAGS